MRATHSLSNKLTVIGGVAALCASVLVPTAANAASTTAQTVVSAAASENVSENRAEEIFLALFFMQGEEALSLYEHDAISQLDGFQTAYDSVNTPDALEMSASVVADLEASDPKYFDRFAQAITSGNPFVVEEQIAQGRADISDTATIAALAEEGAATYVPGEVGPTCGVTVVVGAAFVLAAAVFAAAAAVIWVAAAAGQAVAVAETAVKVRNVKSAPQGDQLYQDWVADVTTTYAGK
ncbi:hypothetical protein [Microbacterium foliorum]|uniref:hypothetical protein n=1 Tax=Microbacterium foliorum TaxID=104336 RepID=UPI0028D3F9E7|nr:hypothetical protein [Microbacterium foliorum]